jgi:hypothetical protein
MIQPDDVRRLKQLEQENARLKKLVAERDLEIASAVATQVVHAVRSDTVGAGLSLGEGGEGWAGAGAHGGAWRAHRHSRQARPELMAWPSQPRKMRPRKRIASELQLLAWALSHSALAHQSMDQGGPCDRGRRPHPLGSRH